MDNYFEYLIKRKFSPVNLLKSLLIVAALIGGCIVIGVWLRPAFAIVLLGFGGYGAFYLISGMSKEFEYIVTNDHLDVDVIVAGRSRKRLCSFDMGDVELCARVSDRDRAGEMRRQFEKTYQCASSKNAENGWFVIFNGEEGSSLLVFEPDERIINAMSVYARSKIFK